MPLPRAGEGTRARVGVVRDSIEKWSELSVVQRWQGAIMSVHGPHPTIRHVLLTLSVRMHSETGANAYPGLRELERRTGLSQRTLIDRLDEADRDGWVRRLEVKRGRRGKCRQYLPAIPGEALKEVQHLEERLIGEGAEPLSAPGGAEGAAKGAEDPARGAEGNAPEALKEVQPSSSSSSSESSSESKTAEVETEEQQPIDIRALFRLLDADDHRWAYERAFGTANGGPGRLAVARDLEYLGPADLRRLRARVAARAGR